MVHVFVMTSGLDPNVPSLGVQECALVTGPVIQETTYAFVHQVMFNP